MIEDGVDGSQKSNTLVLRDFKVITIISFEAPMTLENKNMLTFVPKFFHVLSVKHYFMRSTVFEISRYLQGGAQKTTNL